MLPAPTPRLRFREMTAGDLAAISTLEMGGSRAQVIDGAFRAAIGPRVISTTLAVAWVAAGRRAGYISDGHFVDNVHFAAGIALCRAAGCIVTDLSGAEVGRGRGLIIGADPRLTSSAEHRGAHVQTLAQQ